MPLKVQIYEIKKLTGRRDTDFHFKYKTFLLLIKTTEPKIHCTHFKIKIKWLSYWCV